MQVLSIKQLSKVIWQEAASLCHPSLRRMHSSASCTVGEQCAIHSRVGTLQSAGTCPPSKVPLPVAGFGPHLTHDSLHPHESVPIRHIDWFSRFFTQHIRVSGTHTQTTLRATSVAISRISTMRACDAA